MGCCTTKEDHPGVPADQKPLQRAQQHIPDRVDDGPLRPGEKVERGEPEESVVLLVESPWEEEEMEAQKASGLGNSLAQVGASSLPLGGAPQGAIMQYGTVPVMQAGTNPIIQGAAVPVIQRATVPATFQGGNMPLLSTQQVGAVPVLPILQTNQQGAVVQPQQGAAFVQPQQGAAFVQPQQGAAFVQPQQGAFVQPQQGAFVQPQQSGSSFLQTGPVCIIHPGVGFIQQAEAIPVPGQFNQDAQRSVHQPPLTGADLAAADAQRTESKSSTGHAQPRDQSQAGAADLSKDQPKIDNAVLEAIHQKIFQLGEQKAQEEGKVAAGVLEKQEDETKETKKDKDEKSTGIFGLFNKHKEDGTKQELVTEDQSAGESNGLISRLLGSKHENETAADQSAGESNSLISRLLEAKHENETTNAQITGEGDSLISRLLEAKHENETGNDQPLENRNISNQSLVTQDLPTGSHNSALVTEGLGLVPRVDSIREEETTKEVVMATQNASANENPGIFSRLFGRKSVDETAAASTNDGGILGRLSATTSVVPALFGSLFGRTEDRNPAIADDYDIENRSIVYPEPDSPQVFMHTTDQSSELILRPDSVPTQMLTKFELATPIHLSAQPRSQQNLEIPSTVHESLPQSNVKTVPQIPQAAPSPAHLYAQSLALAPQDDLRVVPQAVATPLPRDGVEVFLQSAAAQPRVVANGPAPHEVFLKSVTQPGVVEAAVPVAETQAVSRDAAEVFLQSAAAAQPIAAEHSVQNKALNVFAKSFAEVQQPMSKDATQVFLQSAAQSQSYTSEPAIPDALKRFAKSVTETEKVPKVNEAVIAVDAKSIVPNAILSSSEAKAGHVTARSTTSPLVVESVPHHNGLDMFVKSVTGQMETTTKDSQSVAHQPSLVIESPLAAAGAIAPLDSTRRQPSLGTKQSSNPRVSKAQRKKDKKNGGQTPR